MVAVLTLLTILPPLLSVALTAPLGSTTKLLVRLLRWVDNRGLCEAAGEHHRASIADAGTVAIADIIVVIAQRRTDGAALADAEAVAERVALIRLQRLAEAAGAVIGQRHRTSIVDGGTVGGGDSIAAIAQRRTDGAALADAEAVAERVALIRLQRLGEAAGAVIGQRHRTIIDDAGTVVVVVTVLPLLLSVALTAPLLLTLKLLLNVLL